jgi:uncharacterized membrane protein
MHVVEAADEDSQQVPMWEGITGRMKQLLGPLATNDRVEAVASKVEQSNMQLTARMDEITGRMDEMVHGQDQIRDLLQTMMAQAR